MNDFPTAVLLIANAAVVTVAAWALVRWLGPELRGPLEPGLAWGLAVILLVAGAGVLLGALGGLGPAGFFATHTVILVAAGWGRRACRLQDRAAFEEMVAEWRRIFLARDATAGLAALLLAVWVALAVLAALAQPVVFDALTYRLSRIGLWLQDGRIAHFATDDARLNYMPVVPDLVMAWLMGAHGGGYQGAALAQTFGGALLLGATAGLARCTGLGRAAALGAAAMILGLANVVPQFTSAYTDLFTAGVFSAAFYLWLMALRRNAGSVLGGAGVALAVGAKGTMFYLAPGALVVVAWLGWRQRAAWPVWRRTACAGVLAALLLVAPGMWRNQQTYDGLFGPVESMQQQHGLGFSLGDNLGKLRLNLATTCAQLFEPNAQPPGLRAVSLRAAAALAERLPESDPFAFEGLDRRANLQKVLLLAEPDADVASCGLPIVCLFLGGLLVACLRPRRAGAELVFLWAAGVVLFVVCLYALLQWHPYSFRFWVLVAPWMTVVAAWGVEALPRGPRVAAWVAVAVCTVAVFWNSTLHTYQAGWSAVTRPERALGFSVFVQTRGWLWTLEPAGTTLAVALPVNRPLAAFLRADPARHVELGKLSALPATAEAAVQSLDGWLVVPARHFAGREGRVEKRTWLFSGDELNPFSLAAYRRVKP